MAGACQTEGEGRGNFGGEVLPLRHLRCHLPLAGEDPEEGVKKRNAALPLSLATSYIARPMARPKPPTFEKTKIVAENRRARYDYYIEQVFEAGIALTGTEVKALRGGEGSIAEAYAEVKGKNVVLVNSNIPEFSHGNRFNHEPKRPRKLLLHEREINKMFGAVARQGMTLVPLMIYFNSKGRAKIELALAKGKQNHDKRDSVKEQDWKREQGRIMRDRG